ncbi:bifunctional phosphoribosylaminoimidazolecarboxamide formyltransferase/IMP cyclohydrolase [Pseudomonadota bacterium]|nr:bifunctional phosphoribosylaminoimidazolecarboxamide formyltransferase/IMP cyclohydrolase [Pseudomonadota bacterium]
MKNVELKPIALISVYDKTGIVELASKLHKLGIKILSTGGTFKALASAGIAVTEVSDYTKQPEIMNGRVKTLHPKIHGGILGRLQFDGDTMARSGMAPINYVIVNLYPFEETISDDSVSHYDAVENIDIGGPAMLRSAAKNYERVTSICDPKDYDLIIQELREKKEISLATRRWLSAKVFSHTARYDAIISDYLKSQNNEETSKVQTIKLVEKSLLRYGENPHQKAWLYDLEINKLAKKNIRLLRGKELSYNNMVDADSAIDCVMEFESPACCIVKHANPCGVGQDIDLKTAYDLAFSGDKTSAFGGVIAFNKTVTKELVQQIVENQFVEIVIAPEFEIDSFKIDNLSKNIRFLETGSNKTVSTKSYEWKTVSSGLLVQEKDRAQVGNLEIVSAKKPTPLQKENLMFAWKVSSYVKSNAIVMVSNQQTVGIGAGQMSRVDSVNLAISKAKQAGFKLKDTCMASDGFFPFKDGITIAAENGVKAVIQPGGSIRDEEVITEANENGMVMIFTGIRHFRH